MKAHLFGYSWIGYWLPHASRVGYSELWATNASGVSKQRRYVTWPPIKTDTVREALAAYSQVTTTRSSFLASRIFTTRDES